MSLPITIMLTLATGFGVLSYRVPRVYKKLYWPIFGLCIFSSVFGSLYTIAWSMLQSKIIPFISPDKLDQANIFFDSLSIHSSWYIFNLLAMIYFGFLNWLSDEIIRHKKPKKKMYP